MDKKIVNWGILGPGQIANKFAEALKYVPNARLYAVGSRNIDSARVFIEKFGAEKAYGSYEQLAADPDIDIIYVATPHVFHCNNTLLCLENGKAVVCEKPFAINEKQVQLMVNKAREKKVFLMEAFWTRFMPTIDTALRMIAEDKLGDVKLISADFGFKPKFDPNSRLYDLNLGGGALLDIGIYPVFLALLIFGEPDDIKVSTFFGKTGVDETISIILAYNDGRQAVLYCTTQAITAVEACLYGTKGRLKFNRRWHNPTSLVYTNNDGEPEDITFNYDSNGYEHEAREATQCILSGSIESPLMSLDFSLRLIRLLDKIRAIAGIWYKEDK